MFPKYTIFDLDGTLYNYEQANTYGISNMINFLSYELKLDPNKLEELYARSRLLSKNFSNSTAESHNIIIYILKMFEICNFPMDLELILESENIYWSAFISKMEAFPKVEELMIDLKSIGSKLVLVTDMSAKIQIRKLIALNFENLFDMFISSDLVGGDKITGKPFRFLNQKLLPDSYARWYIGNNTWDLNLDDIGENIERFKKGELSKQDEESKLKITSFNQYEELRKILQELQE